MTISATMCRRESLMAATSPHPHGRRKGDADIIFNADGSVDAPQTNVIETNEILAGEIRRSVEKFGVALKWDKPAEEVQ
jgi:hypothetical protein